MGAGVSRPRAFVEAPAGLASVSLRLHGGPHCRPPISRMGNKAGYAEVILAALGLHSGQGAGAYVWCEADADVRGLLRAYPDAAMLRRVAEIIRGWADEEPRALWERLRAERKARGPRVDGADVAGWIVQGMWSYRQGDLDSGGPVLPGERRQDTSAAAAAACKKLAEYATVAASNRLIHVADDGTGDLRNTGQGGTTFGGAEFATPAGDVAAAFERAAGDVAAHALTGAWSFRAGEPESGFRDPYGGFSGSGRDGGSDTITIPGLVERFTPAGRWPPVAVLPTIPTAAELSALLGTPGDLEGVVVYSDPPYVGTTGYAADLPRADVVRFALDCDALGAVVCVSEAEALSELVGWHAVEITAGRKGQKRTFSRQQGEWLTMNREPAHRVATQPGLFTLGGAA